MLSAEAAAEPGRWNTDRAPFQRGIMDAATDPTAREIWFMKSSQVGWTELLLNVVGYFAHQDPAPALLVQPTIDIALAFSKDRLATMIRDTPVLAELIQPSRSRDSGNTLLQKQYPGGHITLAGANSPSGLASRPTRLTLFDEVDRFPASAGSEGDPIALGRKRSTTFHNRVMLAGSTPTLKGVSRIEAGFESSDQRRYWVPCPHCDEMQVLKWRQVKWEKGEPRGAWYECEHCAGRIRDAHKAEMLKNGEWRAKKPFKGIVGFHIWEAYSPWTTFGELAAAFIQAKDLPETLQTWTNTALGETWETAGETLKATPLYQRRAAYKIPPDVLVITCGVDVQDDRFELEFVGHCDNLQTWGLGYVVLRGDPLQARIWEDLDALLQQPFTRDDGLILYAAATCIDSGYLTSEVYGFCQPRLSRRVFPTKGMAGAGRAVVTAPVRKKTAKAKKRGVDLFIVGADEAKVIVYSRLKVKAPGPGFCHFSTDYDESFFEGLTAEKRVKKFHKGFPVYEWVKTKPRNEPLDVRVLNLAALTLLNPQWAAIRANQAGAIPPPDGEPAPPDPAPRPPKRSPLLNPRRRGRNWVTGK